MDWLVEELDAFLGPDNRSEGVIETPIPGLTIFQSSNSMTSRHVIYKPVICAVVSGAKRVRLGESVQECEEGQIMSIGFDAVLESTILRGFPESPYRAVSLELDFALLQEVGSLMPALPVSEGRRVDGLFVAALSPTLADALERLFLLVRTPWMVPVLAPGIQREIAFHLLSGPRGADFVQISSPNSHTRLLSRAVREIQRDISSKLRVPELAGSIGMSVSLFHARFKELTSYSPIQYQKHLRLLEARRLMLSEGLFVGDAAYRVGYQSPSQFSREYSRLFGAPPRKDATGGRWSPPVPAMTESV